MKAPLSNIIQKILSNEKKAKAFSAAVLTANRSGRPVIIEDEGKRYKFVRVMSTFTK